MRDSIRAVDLFASHQANIRIIEAAARRIHLPKEKVLTNIDRYANTSSASIPIALSGAAGGGRIRRDDTIVLVGFGAPPQEILYNRILWEAPAGQSRI